MTKEHVSRRDLRNIGFTEPDNVFDVFHSNINKMIARHIDADIRTEIKTNHSKSMETEYVRLLDNYGFDSIATQEWLEQNIPSLRQIEIECRETVLHDFRKN